jgi:hypothetical protein
LSLAFRVKRRRERALELCTAPCVCSAIGVGEMWRILDARVELGNLARESLGSGLRLSWPN